MNIFEGLRLLRKINIYNKLFPYGIDRTMAIVILHVMNSDLSILGIDLVEEGIYETGYYAVLNNLSFKISELTEEEREVVKEICLLII